ncbi:MAG: M48 family metallopeptidase [Candidatus Binatia bacterium]
MRVVVAFALLFLVTGCVSSQPAPRRAPDSAPRRGPESNRRSPAKSQKVDPRQAERLQRIMVPLLRAANTPHAAGKAQVGIVNDSKINAANAGGGKFFVTTGLLEKANDDQLRGVLAHEVAHDDLGHVARAQILGTGLTIGVLILDQIIPGSGALTPMAGQLIARSYSRSEEYEADRHGVEILRRAGYSKEVLIDALTWVMQSEGGSGGGGFLSTHPATADRIEAIRNLR